MSGDQLAQRRHQQAGPVTPILTLALYEKHNYGRGRLYLHKLLKWQDEGREILLVFTGSALRLLAPDKALGAGSAFTELTLLPSLRSLQRNGEQQPYAHLGSGDKVECVVTSASRQYRSCQPSL